ncbi:hypothetical protein C4D60_Mb04t18400 [Musa balbisiana]|uniref:Uncharacterized protein n=2 Tax=Musa TaxID=4640 RepID=A0A4S8KCZ7_MUSBA|nr:hypothetical protein C4D60_Mb04t18400 [Musa balbisiana]
MALTSPSSRQPAVYAFFSLSLSLTRTHPVIKVRPITSFNHSHPFPFIFDCFFLPFLRCQVSNSNHTKITRQIEAIQPLYNPPSPPPHEPIPSSLCSSFLQEDLWRVYTHKLSLLLSSLTSILSTMEAGPKLRLFAVAMMAVVMASSLVEKAAAAEAPAPSPTSGATTLAAPAAVLASLSALLFGYFLC